MSTKLLSFDVGIRNLAYCLIEKKDDNFKILKWDIINLAENQKTCSVINRNNKKCQKNAVFINNYNGGLYYCKTHNKQIIADKSIKEGLSCSVCKKESSCSFDNIEYCEKHGKQELKNRSSKKIPKQNANRIGVNNLASAIFEKLDKIFLSKKSLRIYSLDSRLHWNDT